ncbi:zinc transporter ZntB [Methyloligella solikamskensis]|uniref:Zinc transporter ZntB n=1 Tax=Methyloligella solikamskensis TaxID=1177756 RepID=A0ABW3J924_9HYPH
MASSSLPGVIAESDNGLVFACVLDGKGGAKRIGWEALDSWSAEDGPLWVHLDSAAEATHRWLEETAGLSELSRRVLLEEETRPRVLTTDDGLLAILRAVNLNAGADPDDMVALRMCVTAKRLITIRYRPVMTPRDMLSDLVDKRMGAESVPELFVRLTERLTERMNTVVVELDETLDEVEEHLEERDYGALRGQITEARQTAVGMRRYIGPQRDALARIHIERPGWLNQHLEILLRESADKLQRYIEDLDAARDRAIVIRDEISNRLAEGMNHRMYALSLIAGIFLPLGFVTGLLGVNVGGIPGVQNTMGFWITCALLVIVLIGEVYLFRKLKWF